MKTFKLEFGDQKHPWVKNMVRAPHLIHHYSTTLKIENCVEKLILEDIIVEDGLLKAIIQVTGLMDKFSHSPETYFRSIVPKRVDNAIADNSPESLFVTYSDPRKEAMLGESKTLSITEKPLVGVGLVILNDDETEVLLSRRVKGPDNYLFRWSAMGGKVEVGEHLMTAALRELEEECGLISKDIDHIYKATMVEEIIKDVTPHGEVLHCISFGFRIKLKKDAVFVNFKPEKHPSMRWVKLNYLKDYPDIVTPLTRSYLQQMHLLPYSPIE